MSRGRSARLGPASRSGAGMAYLDAVRSVTRADRPRRRLPAWAVAEGPFGIRLFDVGIVALVIAATEINVITGSGPGAVPLDLRAYLLGALLAVPILFRHRYPFQVMLACAALIFFYYIFARRNISPAPVFFVPLYDATLAGYLVWAVSIATGFMLTGLARLDALRAAVTAAGAPVTVTPATGRSW